MTSRQLVDFIEARFAEHGVKKVIPDDDVIEAHARRIIKQRLVKQAIARISKELIEQAATVDLREDLREHIDVLLEEYPELPWDEALARIISGETALGAWKNTPRRVGPERGQLTWSLVPGPTA